MDLQGAIQAYQSGGQQASLNADVANIGRFATTVASAPSAPMQSMATPSSNGGVLAKFGHFLGGVASETGHLAAGAVDWLARNTVAMAEAPIKLGAGLGHGITDSLNLDQIQAQGQQNSDRLQSVISAYKAGRMTTQQYTEAIKSINQDNNNLVRQTTATRNNISIDQKATTQATWDTAGALVTILTAGFGKAAATAISASGLEPMAAKSAGDFLASQAAKTFFSGTEDFISRVASQPEVFNALSPEAKTVIQRATAEVISSGGTMTAPQIARAAAANLALKYPLYYGTIAGPTADQLYKELDSNKYGDAVRTLAFNAALLMSGGVIGQALKFGGAALKGISARTFGQTSFWDELSKFYGDGSPQGFRNAVEKMAGNMSEADKGQFLRNLSAVESTNVSAMGGDAVAAANRVATGLATNEGVALSSITHEDALQNMVNFAEAQRLADTAAQEAGLGKVAVGRVDARALNEISAKLAPLGDSETRIQAWESLKQQNPSQAWANNANFDTQIKNLIQNHSDATSLDTAIRGIKAQFNVSGFPKAVAAKLAKMGYIPIKPVVNEAPFQEGSGKLISRFAGESDIWTKSVQPLPVLGSMGSLLTKIGLSPQNATNQVYQLYNDALAKNIADTSLVKGLNIVGESPEQSADTIIKKLSSYAHNPTRGGINLAGNNLRAPITDLRQLTTKDIMEALGVSSKEAKEVSSALMQSMLEVPLAVRGLGDKIVDLNYKYNPTAKAYARIQGAARFSWNPFFQVKLAYKTEALAQLESQGKFPTIAGTNKVLSMIFPEHYANLDNIRTVLRDNGIFESKAAPGSIVGGEGVNDSGVASANLTHKLLPSQERSIAGLVATQAQKVNLPVDQFVRQFPNEVRDTVQAIAQYDRNNSFLNSPMARTLNLAFFPFRFETKVASIMAKSLAQTSPMTQLAVIKGMYSGSQFLQSPEGQVWYSNNSDVLKLLTYFTPVTSLSYFATMLGGKADSVGSFGELGGLPLGWIPQLLDAEGITHLTQSAYLDPKTGNELPTYIPATDKGKLLVAVQDLIGQLFTYPGSELGLPSKTSITRNIALGVTGAHANVDLQQGPQLPLTADQQAFQRAIQANQQNGNTTKLTAFEQPTSETITPSDSSTPVKVKAPAARAKKKSDYTPALMPGQSQLGVIPGVQ